MTDDGRLSPEVRAVATVVIVGAIMSILDTTIVNVALDTLSRDLHSPLADIQWVATGYMLALAAVIPVSGWAAGRFGAKRLWVASVVLFTLCSALSGLVGTYLVGDYCTGEIMAIDPTVARPAPITFLLAGGFPLSSFGQDKAGELYVCDLGGTVYKIVAG